MNKSYRQLALFVSVVVFLALGPLMVLYAMGYRFQLGASETLPVGVILVETNPRRAQVSLDDRDIGRTPKAISNLEPGSVNIKVSKEGYGDWSKNVSIEPASITELRTIRLFPTEANIKTLMGDVQTFTLSPNRNLIAAIGEKGLLHVIDVSGEAVIPPVKLFDSIRVVLWSPDSSLILLQGANTTSVADVTKPNSKLLLVPQLTSSQKIDWDQRVPGRILSQDEQGNLTATHVINGASETLATNVKTFATSSKQLFVVTKENQVNRHTLQGELIDTINFESDTNVTKLHITPAGSVALEFSDQSLALLTEDHQIKVITDKALKAGWSPSGRILLVQTDDTSLHVYNSAEEGLRHVPLDELHLVIRLSRPIREAQWYAGGNHIVYQQDDEIIITEIDTRDHPINYVVDSTNLGNSNATVGSHGDNIFYLKNTGAGNRLVSASLVVEEE